LIIKDFLNEQSYLTVIGNDRRWDKNSRYGLHNQRETFDQELLKNSEYTFLGHSERSEESRIFNNLRSFTTFRMAGKMSFAIASRGTFTGRGG
jgi:hypothetical protein